MGWTSPWPNYPAPRLGGLQGWPEMGRQLGLDCAFVSEGSMFGWSFASFRRELAEPALPGDAKSTLWLHGTFNGVSVIVRPTWMPISATDSPLDQFFHALSSKYAPPQEPFTSVMAEIDPPLRAGVQMVSRASARFGNPKRSRLAKLSDARVRAVYWTSARDLRRLDALLFGAGSGDLASRLVDLGKDVALAVHDGVVEAIAPGFDPDAARLSTMLVRASLLAAELSARSRAVPERAGDRERRVAWAEVAARRGLSFDPPRLHLFGDVRGARVDVLLESHVGEATTVRALFRRPLGVGLSLRKAPPKQRWVAVGRPKDRLIEDSALDAAVLAEALDAGGARALLSSPAVVDAFLAATRATELFMVHDSEVFAADPGWLSPQDLEARIDAALAVVDAITPPDEVGPYR
jgi:hypothetical protein